MMFYRVVNTFKPSEIWDLILLEVIWNSQQNPKHSEKTPAFEIWVKIGQKYWEKLPFWVVLTLFFAVILM